MKTATKPRGGRPRCMAPTEVGAKVLAWVERPEQGGSMHVLARRAQISDAALRGVIYGTRDPSIDTLRALRRLGLPERLLVAIVGA